MRTDLQSVRIITSAWESVELQRLTPAECLAQSLNTKQQTDEQFLLPKSIFEATKLMPWIKCLHTL